MTTEYVEAARDDRQSGLRPCPRERKASHRADPHFAGDAVARNLAGERQRQRHRVGDRDFPGDLLAVGGAVEDLGGIAVGALGARQRAARILQGQRRVALAHRRAHGDVPVSVHGHRCLLNACSQNRNGSGIWVGLGGGIAHIAGYAQSWAARDQARAARIRLVMRTRNTTYCTAKAVSFAPINTTETYSAHSLRSPVEATAMVPAPSANISAAQA